MKMAGSWPVIFSTNDIHMALGKITQKHKYISAVPIKDQLVPLWIDPSPMKKKHRK
jgi:hypothetical protein